MRHALLAIPLAALSATALAGPPRTMSRAEVPAELAPAVERGEAAMNGLRDRLFARLNELIVQGGPVNAIQVCGKEAPVLAKELAQTHRVELGRTSHRLRNPANAPRPWVVSHLEAAAGRKAGDVEPVIVDLGDRLGLLRPIGVMPACTRCHGAPDGLDHEVKAALAGGYPQDRATGFAPGDFRGFLWVEVAKR